MGYLNKSLSDIPAEADKHVGILLTGSLYMVPLFEISTTLALLETVADAS